MDRESQRRQRRDAGATRTPSTARTATNAPWQSTTDDGLVRVREYHCTACAGDPPKNEQFERASIAIVRSGVFGIRTDQRTQVLSTGFLLLGNAGQSYEASHEHGVGDRCLVFDFHGSALEDLAETVRRGGERRPFASNVLPPHPRADAFRKLAEEELAATGSHARLEEIGLSMAACVLALRGTGSARREETPDSRRAREHVVAAIARIEQSSTTELRLADLAASTGLGPFHFLKLFKRETGVTPYRFLIQTRIRHAVELLRETRRPITEIAFDVGFGDLSNFIHAFRREVGFSPRRYRQSGLPGGRLNV